VRIVALKRLRLFWREFPDAAKPLQRWYADVQTAQWRNFQDIRRMYNTVDSCRVSSGNTVAIFDIGGNKYRLIAAVHYNTGVLYVLRIMTHREYDRELWKERL
jgi:mRNA interferase HigB